MLTHHKTEFFFVSSCCYHMFVLLFFFFQIHAICYQAIIMHFNLPPAVLVDSGNDAIIVINSFINSRYKYVMYRFQSLHMNLSMKKNVHQNTSSQSILCYKKNYIFFYLRYHYFPTSYPLTLINN